MGGGRDWCEMALGDGEVGGRPGSRGAAVGWGWAGVVFGGWRGASTPSETGFERPRRGRRSVEDWFRGAYEGVEVGPGWAWWPSAGGGGRRGRGREGVKRAC